MEISKKLKIFSRKSATDLLDLFHDLLDEKVQNLISNNDLPFEKIFSSDTKKTAVFCISNTSCKYYRIIESLTYSMAKFMSENIKNKQISIIAPPEKAERVFNKSIVSSTKNYEIRQRIKSTAK